ncbi:MAG: sugar nucleotide-binding protein [Acidimicrobiales bacterium]|nr:sugar nucleotide-binding protein [Acidimicrobiales bacterium]
MATSTVLLTGASGLLGTWLGRTAPGDVDVVPVVHSTPLLGAVRVDLRDATATRAAVHQVAPQVILHTAYALDEASIVDATANLAATATDVGTSVVLISTDAVFSGDGRARAESDEPDPVADYGRWKVEAERLVSGGTSGGAVVRLPLIVSLDPLDHVAARIVEAASSGETTPWFTDELRQPARAEDLARALWQIVALDAPARSGTWHLPGPERLSRFQIAQRYVEALDLDPGVASGAMTPPGLTRPRDLHLSADRARAAIRWDPSPVLA